MYILATRCPYQLHFGFNHASPEPSHHSPLSVDPSLLPSRSHVDQLPCSSSNLSHINTNIHSSKQTPSCIHNFHGTLTVLTNSSFFTHCYTAFLWEHPIQPRSHASRKPPHLYPQFPLYAHPKQFTALSDLTDSHRPDIIALTETWVRRSTTPEELIDSTPPGYSLFSAPPPPAPHRSYTGNPSEPIVAGGTAFLIKEPFIQNSAAHHYSSFEYSSITLKFPKAQLTLFNIYRSPPPSPFSQPFTTFLDQFLSFLSHAATTPHEFITTDDSISLLTTLAILQQSNLLNSLPVVILLSMLKFNSQTRSHPWSHHNSCQYYP